ncbi:redox-sensing transcriptional repressor Rex [Streptococcus dentiloxodontae]
MTFEKNIPNATAKRLSLYYRIFKRFNRENIEKASSKQIADAIGIDPATVRRDFSYFGELGRRGFGYDVNKLMTFFADILNDNSTTKVLLVGVGNIGRALLQYRFHERNRMQLVMAFDTDDNALVGSKTADGIPIYGITQLKEKAEQEKIQTAILTVPSNKAQEVANELVLAGIKGILCFSPVNLTLPKGVVVQYVDLTSELQTLLYFMKEEDKTRSSDD